MKVHILYPFKEGPWGGANQFLKAVRKYFIEEKIYVNNIDDSDIVLFNSSPNELCGQINYIKKLKNKYPEKIFVNRIDGPVFYIRDRNLLIDKAFYLFNEKLCDGTIFQSNWSKEKNYFLGMKNNFYEETILNAPNPDIFNKKDKKDFNKDEKVKLIATSWSSNLKKGFEVYKWLDENLDFNKFKMTFIGNSPFKFKNIIVKEPMNSDVLAIELKSHDIFITASQSDPCSNSLIEAMHCGLPALGLDDGGHTEIISQGGEVFTSNEQIIEKLNLIVENYYDYQENINLLTIDCVGKLYLVFLKKLYNEKNIKYFTKQINSIDFMKIKSFVFLWKIEELIYSIVRKIKKISKRI